VDVVSEGSGGRDSNEWSVLMNPTIKPLLQKYNNCFIDSLAHSLTPPMLCHVGCVRNGQAVIQVAVKYTPTARSELLSLIDLFE
jgi:hypothetical protein